jgi:hypothetical protein
VRSFVSSPGVGAIFPYTFGVIGDLGQTAYSADTIAHVLANPAVDSAFLTGDVSYADGDQPRWDSFQRMADPLASAMPFMVASGNHEVRKPAHSRSRPLPSLRTLRPPPDCRSRPPGRSRARACTRRTRRALRRCPRAAAPTARCTTLTKWARRTSSSSPASSSTARAARSTRGCRRTSPRWTAPRRPGFWSSSMPRGTTATPTTRVRPTRALPRARSS